MADKNAPQAPPQKAGDAKPKSGVAAYLPLILVVVLVPAATWLTIRFMSRGTQTTPAKPTQAEATAHPEASGEKPKKEEELPKFHPELIAPLTRRSIGFHYRKYFGRLAIIDVNGDALGEAEPDKIIANVAGTRGAQIITARLAVQGNDPPLVENLNLNRNQLLDAAASVLSGKNLAEVYNPGITNQLRSELTASFTVILGRGVIQDVRFIELEVRKR